MQSAIAILTGNLPAEPNSFIGRERDLVDLARLLGEVRALTLSGPGGIGRPRGAGRLPGGVSGGGGGARPPGGVEEPGRGEGPGGPGGGAPRVAGPGGPRGGGGAPRAQPGPGARPPRRLLRILAPGQR